MVEVAEFNAPGEHQRVSWLPDRWQLIRQIVQQSRGVQHLLVQPLPERIDRCPTASRVARGVSMLTDTRPLRRRNSESHGFSLVEDHLTGTELPRPAGPQHCLRVSMPRASRTTPRSHFRASTHSRRCTGAESHMSGNGGIEISGNGVDGVDGIDMSGIDMPGIEGIDIAGIGEIAGIGAIETSAIDGIDGIDKFEMCGSTEPSSSPE